MAVIINDFEVIVEPPATSASGQAERPIEAEQEITPQRLTPHDLDSIFRQTIERAERVRAH